MFTAPRCATTVLNVVDAPVMQVLRGAVPVGMDVPVFMQRRWFATALVGRALCTGTGPGSELLPESSPSTLVAQLEVSVEWVRLRERHAGKTYFWNRRTNSTVWQAPAGVEVVWIGERNEEGGVWYWHRDTRVRTKILPPLPPG